MEGPQCPDALQRDPGVVAQMAARAAVERDRPHRVKGSERRVAGVAAPGAQARARKRYVPLPRSLSAALGSVYAYSPGSRSIAPPGAVRVRTTPPSRLTTSRTRRPTGLPFVRSRPEPGGVTAPRTSETPSTPSRPRRRSRAPATPPAPVVVRAGGGAARSGAAGWSRTAAARAAPRR